ncbi:hypothetical protein CVT24_003484 [Panaeolus cyanescens]|uniref:Uncharacterized protein n=1 Tax=Panaeolus cyanescens TaxID=181874 RepID=A0A409Y7E9_9AGAR|nr:hypothetical protein CVT24_003484 [Panaeolus cyanescens]
MSTSTARRPYAGTKRKLVIAFDVGTTFSGISYAIMDPGHVPEIRGVTQFPGQENVGGDCKIPTILYYDSLGAVRAAGAEAKNEAIEERALDEGWVKAEWYLVPSSEFEIWALVNHLDRFKLHLSPNTRNISQVTNRIPALPSGKTAVTVYADFLQYLYKCAENYIKERHANGVELWRSLQGNCQYVITHPNGWEGAQQSQLRRAAVLAKLFPDDANGHARLTFLTEGEASLHFCVGSDLTTESIRVKLAFSVVYWIKFTVDLKAGRGILIVDAGGGTIDISGYKHVARAGYEETAVPQCHLQGSIMVTNRAKGFLKGYLQGTRFYNDAEHIAESFDKSTKHVFRNVEDWQYIRFGSPRDHDVNCNIRRGQLKLSGSKVAEFFKPSVDSIVNSIKQQRRTASSDIRSVFLVGGFAANTYLFNEVKTAFVGANIDISRPDPNRVSKAVADGAVSFYLDRFVTARIAKFDYGTEIKRIYDVMDPAHQSRADGVMVDCLGRPYLLGAFSRVLSKGTKVKNAQQFRAGYRQESLSADQLRKVKVPIICYRGDMSLDWFDEDPLMFHTLCHVEADTPVMSSTLFPKFHYTMGGRTIQYYELRFEVGLTVGSTELTAHIRWSENGIEKSSAAELIYDPDAIIPGTT